MRFYLHNIRNAQYIFRMFGYCWHCCWFGNEVCVVDLYRGFSIWSTAYNTNSDKTLSANRGQWINTIDVQMYSTQISSISTSLMFKEKNDSNGVWILFGTFDDLNFLKPELERYQSLRWYWESLQVQMKSIDSGDSLGCSSQLTSTELWIHENEYQFRLSYEKTVSTKHSGDEVFHRKQCLDFSLLKLFVKDFNLINRWNSNIRLPILLFSAVTNCFDSHILPYIPRFWAFTVFINSFG